MDKDTILIIAALGLGWLLLRPRAAVPVQASPAPYDPTTLPSWAPQQQNDAAQIISAINPAATIGAIGGIFATAYNGG